MKTAEEFLFEYMRMIGVDQSVIDNPDEKDNECRGKSMEFFKAIQLDALQEAANGCVTSKYPDHIQGQALERAFDDGVAAKRKAILSLATTLTNGGEGK